MLFADRQEAGERLAATLLPFKTPGSEAKRDLQWLA